MGELISPADYNDVVMVLSYDKKNYFMIIDENKNMWDGQFMPPEELEDRLYGIEVEFEEQKQCFMIYMGPDSKGIRIDSDGHTAVCFAEIGRRGEVTERNTKKDGTFLPKGSVTVVREGRGMKIIPGEDGFDYKSMLEQDLDFEEVLEQDIDFEGVLEQDMGFEGILEEDLDYEEMVRDLSSENERLKELAAQLAEHACTDVYTQIEDLGLEQQMEQLYQIKAEYEEEKQNCEQQKERLKELGQQVQDLKEEGRKLEEELALAKELERDVEKEVLETEQRLNVLLNDFGMDRQVLEQYQSEEEMIGLLKKAQAMEEEIRQALKNRIAIRQQICQKRHDDIMNIAGYVTDF